METEAVLKEFDFLVEKYAQHRHYIDKARAHSTGFNPAVVEKVILDHEIHASEVADRILPLVPRIQEVVADVEARASDLEKARSEVDERMQELKLRQVIGEMDDAEFDEAASAIEGDFRQSATQLEALRKEREAFGRSLDRWVELAREARQATGLDEPPPAPVQIEDDGAQVEVVDDEAIGQHVTRGAMVEDVSPVFAEPAAPRVEADVVEFGAVEPEADDGADVDLALLGEGGGSGEAPEAIDISPETPAAADSRHALLLYQEGTPEEQIYPFTGDTLTIGRGRDNDIQIKNDSKVSRYHCKLFRRGANFYIEDNKSSNGTLVGGELVTEHRLLGGEEIIIGETFFRFRIMD